MAYWVRWIYRVRCCRQNFHWPDRGSIDPCCDNGFLDHWVIDSHEVGLDQVSNGRICVRDGPYNIPPSRFYRTPSGTLPALISNEAILRQQITEKGEREREICRLSCTTYTCGVLVTTHFHGLLTGHISFHC